MGSLTDTATLVITLILAVIIGNRFLAEVKKARERKDPWYAPYFSLPGLLILAALCIPMLLWLFRR